MKPISFARHRFPPDVIRHAVWLYLRFTLSYRDVEDLLEERGLIVSNEAIRRWVLKFGPVIARNLRKSRPQSYTRWHLDEMGVSLSGKQMRHLRPLLRGRPLVYLREPDLRAYIGWEATLDGGTVSVDYDPAAPSPARSAASDVSKQPGPKRPNQQGCKSSCQDQSQR
jgi:hypothetical protein